MRSKYGKLLMGGGLALLLGAISLTGYNLWDEQRASRSAEQALNMIYASDKTWITAEGSAPKEDGPTVPDYRLFPNRDMPTVMIDGEAYIGTISIPVLDLELPVISEWSYPRMKLAPCRYSGSAYLDNLIIMAHNYRQHFGSLATLQPGDAVIFTDVDGNEFRYSVVELETLDRYEVREMEAGDWRLTLFTCNMSGQARVTVRCE